MRISVEIVRVRAREIDLGRPWILWPEEPGPELCRSLRQTGQLCPVLAQRTDNGWELAAGYKRAKVLAALERPVQCLEVEGDEAEKGLLYLADNASWDRPLSLERQVKALVFFKGRMDRAGLEQKVAPALGLAPRGKGWRRFMKWLELSGPGRDFLPHLEQGRVPLDAIDVLSRLEPGELEWLEPFFRKLAWSKSAGTTFISMLYERARANGATMDRIKQGGELKEILCRELSPKDKIERLSRRARSLCYPNLSELEKKSFGLARELSAGTIWRIERADSFETDTAVISARVGDRAGLERAASELSRMSDSRLWDDFFGLADAPNPKGGE